MAPLDHLADHECTRCPLHETTERVCVMGDGSIKRGGIMVIGEAPGEREAETGKVFSGRAGQLLDFELGQAGLRREDLYVTNVTKCRPPENARPERIEWEACRIFLERECRKVAPRFVLLLGNTALQAVAKRSGITSKRGVRLDIKDPLWSDRAVMATIHPAYVLRNPGQASVFSEDIKRFARLIRGEFQVASVKVRLISTSNGVRALRSKLLSLPPTAVVSYDVESRYYPWNNDWAIVCLGLNWDGETTYVVPLYHPESPFRKNWLAVLRYLKPGLEHPTKKVAQNGKFDNLQLAGGKVFLRHSFDIMLAAHVLDENRPKNLGFLSQSILGADEYKGMVETHPDKILKEPLRKLALYNGNDVAYTHQIYSKLRGELLAQPRATRLFTKLLMPASHVMQEVEATGWYVDQERLLERMVILQGMIDEQLEVLNAHNLRASEFSNGRGQDFNYNSTQQLGRWLFSSSKRGGLGLSPLEHTKTGAPSTREGVLLHYHSHPAVAALLRYRTLQLKWMNTCLAPWSMRLDAHGRLHTSYKIFGTVTGRLSGDMQQVPRDPFIRSVFGAPPGYKFVEADYSQIEMRIAAHVAREKRMIRTFLADQDLHLLTATRLLGIPPEDVTKEQRKKAKAVNFGFLYGMYPKKFQTYAFENYDLEVSLGEAEVARQQYFEMFPGLLPWHDRQKRIAHIRHYVTSPIGRTRHLPDILSSDNGVRMEAERQAINSPVQSMASDLMLFSMVQLHTRLPSGARMVGTLHDAIFFEVREELVDEVVPLIKETMENLPLKRTFGVDFRVPIVAEVEAGSHWGEY